MKLKTLTKTNIKHNFLLYAVFYATQINSNFLLIIIVSISAIFSHKFLRARILPSFTGYFFKLFDFKINEEALLFAQIK